MNVKSEVSVFTERNAYCLDTFLHVFSLQMTQVGRNMLL